MLLSNNLSHSFDVSMSAEIMADSSERPLDTECHPLEPEAKRQKVESVVKPLSKPEEDKLEQRLGGILCCAVCLDLPKSAVYQASFHFSELYVHYLCRYIMKPQLPSIFQVHFVSSLDNIIRFLHII